MIHAHAEAAKNISIAAENNLFKEVILMLEYDEYRLELQGFEKNINDLRDSL